jgi:ATP-binding cassette subfamily B protein
MLAKDLSFFHNNFAGSLTKRTSDYALRFEIVTDTLGFLVVPQFLPLIFVCIILWHFSPLLVFGLVGMMALTILCVIPLINRRQKLVDKREAARNVVAGHVADVYTNIDAVRTFSHEPYEQAIHTQQVKDMMKKTRRSWDYQNQRVFLVTSPLYVLTNVIGLIIALSLGNGNADRIGEIFITFSYYATFTRSMFDFNQIYRQVEGAMTEVSQFTALQLDKPKLQDPEHPVPLHITKTEVVFRDISFTYSDGAQEPLFSDFNLVIKSGEKVGLVGRSGGGKTTITKLLLRLMDVTGGEILIDGQNIAALSQADLRSVIGYVPQDPVMFHRSLADNIRYGKLDATDDEVQRAARQAHAADFIALLPDGYNTLVGERGIKLSGGQRQRIAIARAMLKNAPLLVLDEATSALDSESERTIQTALWELMKDKTALVIAHRLSTIQKMDRIIVLDNGTIIEEGSHADLLKQGGLYATLWNHQSGGFIE